MPGEIMTANSDTLRSAALSRVTVGSLHDMNFAVDYKAANKYTKNDLNPACVCENHNHAISHRNLEDQTTTHSTISKRALQDAASIGKDLLAKMGQDDDENKSDFVGDYGVFVLYEEDGEVFGIHVKNDP